MEHTKNYNLPQWEKDDRIMMEDFNQMCASIENGMSANAQAAERAAELPYAVGTYTGDYPEIQGNGQEYTRCIEVGFRPRFVLICGNQGTNTSYFSKYIFMAGPEASSDRCFMTDTGFRIEHGPSIPTMPCINAEGHVYNYIAFR